MQIQNIRLFCENQAVRLMSGHLDVMAERFVEPLPVYAPAGLQMFKNRAELVSVVKVCREELIARGIARITARDIRIVDTSGARALVSLAWHHLDAQAQCQQIVQANYILSKEDGAVEPMFELVEFLRRGATPSFAQL